VENKIIKYFEGISNIPRGSGNEKAISDYLVKFAKDRNLEVVQDESLNVIIRKPGSKGFENAKTVVIQGHMDMVCEKNLDTIHDFEKDPIKLQTDGDYIKATGTTLGADNGIAIAYGLALLDDNSIAHPPLEILLTTAEETGMDGAIGLEPKNIKGRILLNIDSEEEGTFLVSCSGGMRCRVSLNVEWEDTNSLMETAVVKIRGLKGGHSGMDIIKQRGNANKVMGRVLFDIMNVVNINLCSLSGGSKNNAIPREMDASFVINCDKKGAVKEKIKEWNEILKNEFRSVDDDLTLEVSFESIPSEKMLSRQSTEKTIKLLYMIPNGIQTMSNDIKGLVQSSNNLGVVKLNNDTVNYDSAIRSSIKSLKLDIFNQIYILGDVFGATVSKESDYPEWQYEPNSEIRDICVNVYKKMYGKEPEVTAMHAGVECGLFKEKFKEMDMISFGPNLYDVHTPEERMSISSVNRVWEYLLNVLKEIK
jgi:dipeptidase D